MPPDAQSLLVSAQPAAHIVRNANRTGGNLSRGETAGAVHPGHETRQRLPLGQPGQGDAVVDRGTQRLRGLPLLV